MLRSKLLSALAIFQVSFLRPAQTRHPPFGGPPANATDLKIIRSPQGAEIRFREPGICETTPGVKSYSGYISLNETTNMFFWFFERRKDPHNAPFTLWLGGGPGYDSIASIFVDNGPCKISPLLKVARSPYSWNEASNMLYLSQPIGVGFSYANTSEGCFHGFFEWSNCTEPDGRFPIVNRYAYPTSYIAAEGTWHILQAFMANLPQLDPSLSNKDVDFHLWTISYGGHYGPAFYDYFYKHNLAIGNGTENGTQMNMGTLGIINGIIDIRIQAPYFPIFANNNTYGYKAVNDSVYTFMEQVYRMPGGCNTYLKLCTLEDRSTFHGKVTCAIATHLCYQWISFIYRKLAGRGMYDIRRPRDSESNSFVEFLNLADTQAALGVSINYTDPTSSGVYEAFFDYGDLAYPMFKTDLEGLLQKGVRVALFYGDADFLANWMGGEAVSLALDFEGQEEFKAAGYAPLVVDEEEYGVVRQYGNFSFARIYDSGHSTPFSEPKASLEFFRRTLEGLSVSDGLVKVGKSYKTNGTAKATHTE